MKNHFFDIAKFPDFEKSNWIVVSYGSIVELTTTSFKEFEEVTASQCLKFANLRRLPFQKTSFLVTSEGGGNAGCLRTAEVTKQAEEGVYTLQIRTYTPRGGVHRMVDGHFSEITEKGYYRFYPGIDEETARKMVISSLVWIGEFLNTCDNFETITRAPKDSAKNASRVARGFAPVEFEWKVTKIEPRKPKSEHQGGTHASPRYHKRRGHMRHLKSGKTVFIKECFAGDINKGFIAKEYQI